MIILVVFKKTTFTINFIIWCYAAYSFWFIYPGDSLSTQIIFDMSHFFLFKTFYYLFFTRTRAPTSYAHRLLTALVLRDVQYYIIILSRTFLSFQQFESSRIILILTMILIEYEARNVVVFYIQDSNKGFDNFYIFRQKKI